MASIWPFSPSKRQRNPPIKQGVEKREGVPEMGTKPLKAVRGYRVSNWGSKLELSRGVEKYEKLGALFWYFFRETEELISCQKSLGKKGQKTPSKAGDSFLERKKKQGKSPAKYRRKWRSGHIPKHQKKTAFFGTSWQIALRGCFTFPRLFSGTANQNGKLPWIDSARALQARAPGRGVENRRFL